MRQAARITLFVHDRDGRIETMDDLAMLHLLLQQAPLVTRNDDGSCTYVFDLVEPGAAMDRTLTAPGYGRIEALRHCGAAMARLARDLGLPLTAALADSAELVAESELRAARVPPHLQC